MLIASPVAGLLYDFKSELPFIVSLGLLGFALILSLRFTQRKDLSRSVVASSNATSE
jgi:hypothetical protein